MNKFFGKIENGNIKVYNKEYFDLTIKSLEGKQFEMGLKQHRKKKKHR